MQTKLIEILSEAMDWMTAAEIANKGSWRSPSNVGVALQQMEKGSGNVERRKSATKKQGNGMPATEWKLTEKSFGETVENASTKASPISSKLVDAPGVRISHATDEPAPVFTQPAHDN